MSVNIDKINSVFELESQWCGSGRINWDEYFMCLAVITSFRSPCSRLHVGCVLVKDKRVVSMGYNGFPTGEPHKSILRKGDDGQEHEIATIHAEQNSICYGANTGVSLKDSVAYITHYPCLNCAKLLLSSGITTIKYHSDYNNDPAVPIVCSNLLILKI